MGELRYFAAAGSVFCVIMVVPFELNKIPQGIDHT